MHSIKRALLVIILLALVLLILYWPSDDDLEVEPNPKQTPQIHAPHLPAKVPATPPKAEPAQEVEVANEPLSPKHTKETQDFLGLVEHAHSPEDIFQKPGRFVIAHRVDNNWIAQGDVLVDPKTLVEGVGDDNIRVAQLNAIVLWPENTVPYRVDPTLDASPIMAAISAMNQQTNIKFVESKGENDFIFFRRAQSGPCLSFVGRIGGAQAIWVNPATCGFGNILHEMMHAIGFNHEHSREDRDNYLTIHWNQIEAGLQHNFQKLSSDFPLSNLGVFDFDSILLYSSEGLAGGGAITMTKKDGSTFKSNRAGLSKGDIAKINALYPKIE